MSAYVFWHRPFADTGQESYEAALIAFHSELVKRNCEGFQRGRRRCRISEPRRFP